MPEIDDYLSGFGILNGLELSGYRLISAVGSHLELSKGNYEYPVTMRWRSIISSAKHDDLIRAIAKKTERSKVIYSKYGNPYECEFGEPQLSHIESDGTVVITAVGNSHRLYENRHELVR